MTPIIHITNIDWDDEPGLEALGAKLADALLEQKGYAIDPNGRCQYRQDGKACIVGLMLYDDEAESLPSLTDFDDAMDLLNIDLTEEAALELETLQNLHDDVALGGARRACPAPGHVEPHPSHCRGYAPQGRLSKGFLDRMTFLDGGDK
jgi:hypothetical protein